MKEFSKEWLFYIEPLHNSMRGFVVTEWLEYTTDWGYWINPDTFRTPRIKKSIRVGAIFFIKTRETLEDGRQIIVTTYGVTKPDGTREMDKRDASKILAKQMLDYMLAKKMYPPKTSFKKSYANGNVDLSYEPTEYDSFTIRLTPELVRGNVEDFLDSLSSFEEIEKEASWKIEPAKSGRATCRTCSKPISKGELRIGEPYMFDEHVTYRWHHLSCQLGVLQIMDLEDLDGYSELSPSQRDMLKDVPD